VLVTILLTLGTASVGIPALLSETDDAYSFSLNHAVRGLVGLVFNVYVIYLQVQLSRICRQVSEQFLTVDKVGCSQKTYTRRYNSNVQNFAHKKPLYHHSLCEHREY
jgi:hypothetical protein